MKERERFEVLIEGLNTNIKRGLANIESMRQGKLILRQLVAQSEQSKDTGKHTTGKSKVEGMLSQLERCLQQLRITVLSDMYKARMSLKRLDEITLKPDPLSEVQ